MANTLKTPAFAQNHVASCFWSVRPYEDLESAGEIHGAKTALEKGQNIRKRFQSQFAAIATRLGEGEPREQEDTLERL